jgi:putative transposase
MEPSQDPRHCRCPSEMGRSLSSLRASVSPPPIAVAPWQARSAKRPRTGNGPRWRCRLPKPSPFRDCKTSPEIIHRAVMPYIPFPMSLRNTEDRPHRRGIEVSDEAVRTVGLKASMSGHGSCYDNAAVLHRENSPLDCSLILRTFFKTIKAALIWRRSWDTRRMAETAFGHAFEPMAVMPSLQHINGFLSPTPSTFSTGRQKPRGL